MKEFVGGSCFVANEVIDSVIAQAASRMEGVEQVKGFDARNGKLRSHYKNYICTKTQEGHLTTMITLSVDREAKVQEVVHAAQLAVKNEVESMFGLVCDRVDVAVI